MSDGCGKFCVYILRSQNSGHHYVGCTQDLPNRLAEHAAGETKSTRNRGPWVLVHVERFETNIAARKREREIKAKKSARYIEWLIETAACERALKAFGKVAGSNPAVPTSLR